MAATTSNTAILWKEYVDAGVVQPEHFVTSDAPIPKEEDLNEGDVIVELVYVSVDPYMRGRMRPGKGYFVGAFVPGEPLDGGAIAKVTASKTDRVAVGAHVVGFLKWQKQQIVRKDQAASLQVVDVPPGVPLSAFMGPLGMVGATAYCSLAKIGQPKAGEQAFVSGAAGAVGYIVGQLLKNVYGCRVVGSAGSDEKVAWLKSLGYDEAWNYKAMSTEEALTQYCPQGIDVYFDNVGGETLDVALNHMNTFGRIVGCGSISQYDAAPQDRYGVKNLFNIVTKRLLFQGFIVGDLLKEQGPAFKRDMPTYVKEGKVTVEEVVVEGLDQAGQAFCDMMKGVNKGKMIVKV